MSKQVINHDHNAGINRRQTSATVSIDLQMSLLNTWTKHHVADYYQNIFLTHLDQLQPALVEDKIKKEIKLTLQRNTLFYSMQNLNFQLKNVLLQLQQQLSKPTKDVNSQLLSNVCQKVKFVRDINLHIGETIIKMYQQFHCNNQQMRNRQLAEFVYLIEELELNIIFIKNSYLNQYIRFGQGFDPFFMKNYEQIHRQNYENTKQQIRQLYSLNISYVYRLMKVKNKLLDIRSAYEQPFPMKKRLKQVIKLQNLPTLHTQNMGQQNHIFAPVKISPIKIFQSRQGKSSRTTIYPMYKERPESSHTEEYSRPRLKFSKVMDPLEQINSISKKMKKNNVYILTDPNQDRRRRRKKYQFKQFDNRRDIELSLNHYPRENQSQDYNNSPYRKHRYSHSERYQNQFSKMNNIIELKPPSVKYVEPSKQIKIKNYNPIKRQHFQLEQNPITHHRYDFNPRYKEGNNPYPLESQSIDESQGLDYETPLSKYNIKGKYKKKFSMANEAKQGESSHRYPIKSQKQYDKTSKPYKSQIKHQKIDQECQTIQMNNLQNIQKQSKRQQSSRANPHTVNRKEAKHQKPSTKRQSKDDQTIQNGEIIDERPFHTQNKQEKPLIRQVVKQPQPLKKPISLSPRKNEAQLTKKNTKQEKKQIKMKSGKYTIQEVLKLLQKSTILPEYTNLFDMQKLVQWIKASQTYLTQFYINDVCVIIALCSPIPSIGMAIKLWAPVHEQANQNVSINLFGRYIEFIEKSTTCEKIMFNGNGETFKQLKSSGFTMKKEKLYERARKTAPKKIESQFKPFLYVECSTVNFFQNSKEKMLFSQEIEEFSQNNCYLANVLGQININKVPQGLKPFIKINQKVPNFIEVNKILVKQCFDQYEASQIKPSNISLLRLYFNSSFKSTFIAGQGHLKLVGFLLYQKDLQCLISVNTVKNNGNMYFSKNMSFESILQKSKLVSNNKVSLCVKMFTKKLYGKLIKYAPGSYGNFQINLAFEDEMQGRIKHNMKIQRCFGPEQFTICIQVEKCNLLCLTIGKDDFIY